MITIGRLAKEYGLLPSEVVVRATSFDIMITDVLATYTAYTEQKASGSIDPDLYGFTNNEMETMMETARGS